MRCRSLFVLLLLAGLSASSAGRAADVEVDTALVLAVDVSGSVSRDRWELQKRGYVEAFRSPDVANAIASGPRGAVAVAFVEWSGQAEQEQVIGWTVVCDPASAQSFADKIAAAPRVFSGATSLSGAIDFSVRLLQSAEFDPTRRIIDISGDGSNNDGRSADQARDEALARHIVINGLPILAVERNLDDYYRDQVIGGPGAFVVVASSFDNFAGAILKKLLLEIAMLPADGRALTVVLP